MLRAWHDVLGSLDYVDVSPRYGSAPRGTASDHRRAVCATKRYDCGIGWMPSKGQEPRNISRATKNASRRRARADEAGEVERQKGARGRDIGRHEGPVWGDTGRFRAGWRVSSRDGGCNLPGRGPEDRLRKQIQGIAKIMGVGVIIDRGCYTINGPRHLRARRCPR
jgi:hypothetical protein